MAITVPDTPVVGETGHVTDTVTIIEAIQELDARYDAGTLASISAAAAAASASESAAAASASAASGSASAASGSASAASGSASTATTKASEAAASAAAALVSENAAAASASTATTQAGIATTQAGLATTERINAAGSASTASTKASEAGVSAAAALVSQNAAASSASSASSSAIAAAASAASAAASVASGVPVTYTGSSTSPIVKITQTGSGPALLVEDSASTDSTPFIVDASGNVGVGLSSPATLFDVGGTARISRTGTPAQYIDVFSTGGSGIIRASSGTPLELGVNALHLAIATGGQVIVGGTSASQTIAVAAGLQVTGTGAGAYQSISRFANSTAAPGLIFGKSRGASIATHGLVAGGDDVGEVAFYGSDGASWIYAAGIKAGVDTTAGVNDMPGNLRFFTTADGAASGTERLRIDSVGRVGIGLAGGAAMAQLHVVYAATAAPSLTYGTVAGQILRNENSELAIGLYNSGGFPLWLQGRTSGNAARHIVLQPLGGNIGIGTAANAPTEFLHIASNAGNGGFRMEYGGTGVWSRLYFDRARTSKDSPTVVADGDTISQLFFRAHDGSNYLNTAAIQAQVDGTPGTNDMPGRLTFWTTPDGSSTLTERMRIAQDGLITGTGPSLGAWTAYTPTLGGTGWALGDGTLTFKYVLVGKTCHISGRLSLGSTSTAGAGSLTLTYPFSKNATTYPMGTARLVDNSAGKAYESIITPASNSAFALTSIVAATTGELGGITTSVPFTWASGDYIDLSLTYEIA